MGYISPSVQTAVIANGGTTSQALRMMGVIAGIMTPATLTSTSMSFLGGNSRDGAFNTIYDSNNNAISADVAGSRSVAMSGSEADAIAAFPFIKLVMGSTEGGEREIAVISR
jgi:hypothetical protein